MCCISGRRRSKYRFQQHTLLLEGKPTKEVAPTLTQALEACRGRIMVNIDPKDIDFKEAVHIARDMNLADHMVFKKPIDKIDPDLAQWFAKQHDILFMPICDSLDSIDRALAVTNWPMIEILVYDESDPLWNPDTLDDLRKQGVRPWINTISDGYLAAQFGDFDIATTPTDKVYHPVFDAGYRTIQTDEPARLLESFQRYQKQND